MAFSRKIIYFNFIRMLIRLDDSLIKDCGLADGKATKFKDCFENIADIRRRGFHFIYASRSLLECLANNVDLSSSSRAVFNKMFLNFSTESAILNEVDDVAIVSARQNNGTFRLRIEDFRDDAFLSKNVLLLENSNDSRIYLSILKYYLKRNQLRELNHKWDVRNGGGSTTHAEFKRLTELKETFTFCILDSDKTSPTAKLGGTAEAFQKKPVKTNHGVHLVLPVHEMENLIPIRAALALTYGNSKFRTNQNVMSKLAASNKYDFYIHADLKKGLSKFKITTMSDKCKIFWEEQVKELGLSTKSCNCISDSCKHFYIQPFGKDFTANILDMIEKIECNIESFICEFFHDIWTILGKKLSNYFCCPRPLIT
jgi:hypothetical protein